MNWSTYLSDIKVGLHDEERIAGVLPVGVGRVEELPDLRESTLGKVRAGEVRKVDSSIGVVARCGCILGFSRVSTTFASETELRRSMRQCRADTSVQCTNFFQPGRSEGTLRRRPLVHTDADQDFSEEGEDTGDVVEARDDSGLVGRLRMDGMCGDTGRVDE